jgi:thiamine kinase-like enzyme
MHEEVTIPELTVVVARLAALLGKHEGAVVQLKGGITNRNFRVNFGGTDYVVRLPGKKTNVLGIDREAERMATKAAAGLDIAPPVAAMLEDPPCLVTSFVAGRLPSAGELRAPAFLEAVGRNLRAFHDSGAELPTGFDTVALADDYARIAAEHGIEPPAEFAEARRRAEAIKKTVAKHWEHTPVSCHNDLLTANFILDEGDVLRIIDWEYAGMGDRYFDLGNFAVNNGLGDEDEERFLTVYFGEPPDARQSATLKLFRYMSDLREAMWGVVQTAISALDFDFEGYAAKHFARLAETGSDPRFDTWLRDARG